MKITGNLLRWKMEGGRWKIYAFMLFFTSYFLLLTSYLSAGTPGTSGAQFLNIPLFARPVALGEAYTGYAAGAFTIEYNPAGLSNVIVKEGWFSYLSYFENTTLQAFAVALPYREFVVGFAGKYHNTKDTEMDVNCVKGKDFNITDYSFMPSIAYKISPHFSVGCSIKSINQKLKDQKSSSFAVDFGVFQRFPVQKASIGIAVMNIGPGVKFKDEEDPLPLSLKLGGAWSILAKTVILLEVIQPNDGGLKQRFGAEYQIMESFWLRIGWKVNQREFKDYTGFTSGFGMRYNKFYLDYAFVPHSDLGISHYVTTGIKFGESLPMPKGDMKVQEE